MRRRHLTLLTAAAAVALGTVPAIGLSSTSVPLTRVPSMVLPVLSHATVLGPTAPGTSLEIALDLRSPYLADERRLEAAQQDPASADYHRYLTPAAFDARFGAPVAQRNELRTWATRKGLTIASAESDGYHVLLAGTAAQAERTFDVHLRDYSYRGTRFYANADAPAVPADLPLIGVIGLNSLLRSTTAASHPAAARPQQDSCTAGVCMGLTTPQDMWAIYDQPSTNLGEGQRMAIFGEGQTDGVINDLRAEEKIFGLRRIPVSVVHASGATAKYTDDAGHEEWDIDTQSSTGMSPNALEEVLYFGVNLTDADVLNVLNAWADDPNGPKQASASYGECEEYPAGDVASPVPTDPTGMGLVGYAGSAGAAYTVSYEQTLQKAVLEGRTLFASTGDTGSSCPVVYATEVGAGNGVANQGLPVVGYPASSPHVVAVGGTVLYTDGATPPQRVQETGWTFGGGGSSVTFAEPDYQKTAGITLTGMCVDQPGGAPATPGTVCRGIPDVSAQSGDVTGNGYSIVGNGSPGFPGGGTSLSSPMTMGLWTRIQAAAGGTLGFANNTFYKQYTTSYANDFFDVGGDPTVSPPTTNGVYPSTPGWDYQTGIGVPDVAHLMKDVTGRLTPVDPTLPAEAPEGSAEGGPVVDPACVPLFRDASGDDAYIGDPAGSGSNPQLDIVQGDMKIVTAKNGAPGLQTTLTIADLSASPAVAAGAANEYYMVWTDKTKTVRFTNAEIDTTSGAISYGYGAVDGRTYTSSSTDTANVTGSVTMGKNGTVQVTVPLADIGATSPGSQLTTTGGQTKVLVGSTATGGLIEAADDAGPGNTFTVGEVCAATGTPGTSGAPAGSPANPLPGSGGTAPGGTGTVATGPATRFRPLGYHGLAQRTVAFPSGADVPVAGHAGVPASGVQDVWLQVRVDHATSDAIVKLGAPGSPGNPVAVARKGRTTTTLAIVPLTSVGSLHVGVSKGSARVRLSVAGVDALGKGDGYVTVRPPQRPHPTSRTAAGQDTVIHVAGAGGIPSAQLDAVLVLVRVANASTASGVAGTVLASTNGKQLEPVAVYSTGHPTDVLVVARPDTHGDVHVRLSSGSAHLVVTQVGAWRTPGTGGAVRHVVTPTSVFQGKIGTKARVITLQGRGGVPNGPSSVVIRVTVSGATAPAEVLLGAAVAPDGAVAITPGAAGVAQLQVRAGGGRKVSLRVSRGSAHVRLDIVGYAAAR